MSVISEINNKADFIGELPVEVGIQVLSYLDPRTLAKCCCVNETWRKMAMTNSLWIKCFPVLKPFFRDDLKEFIDRHSIGAINKIFPMFQDFLKSVELNKAVKFICIFPYNPRYRISVELKVGENPSDQIVCKTLFLMEELEGDGRQLDILGDNNRKNSSYRISGCFPNDDIHLKQIRGAIETRIQEVLSEKKWKMFYYVATATALLAGFVLYEYMNLSQESRPWLAS